MALNRFPHIILVGLMGSGKSSVGRYLAKRTGWLYSDIDTMVEAYSRQTISQIFAEQGEDGFRDVEEEMVELAVKDMKPGIIATGGGAIISEQNRTLMLRYGYVIYLRANPEFLLERIKKDTSRPLLQTENPQQVLKKLYLQRQKYYRQAHVEISVENRTVRSLSSQIWKEYCQLFPGAKGV
ncbi:MAG: shikimate kinase [Verrucomicrobiota bacterium]